MRLIADLLKLQKKGYSDFYIIMQLNKRELQNLLRTFESEYSGKVKENIFKIMLDYYFESIENTIIDLEIEEGIKVAEEIEDVVTKSIVSNISFIFSILFLYARSLSSCSFALNS